MSTLTPNPLAEQIRAMVAQERAAARHQPIPDAPTTPEREVVRQMVTQARMNRHQWAGGITPESLGAPPTAGEAGDYATPAAVLTPQAPQDPVAAVRARLARMDAGLPGQPPPADPRAGWIDEGAPAMQSIPDPGFVGNLIEGAKQGFAAATPAGLRSDPYGPGPLPAQGVGGFLGTVAGSLNPLGMLKPENAPFIAVGAMAGGAIARALRPITGKIASKLGGRAAAAFDDAIAEAPEEAAQAMAEQASKENWDRDPWGALQRTLAAGALGGTAGGLAGGALGGAFKTKPEHRPTRAEVLEAERAAPYTVRPEVEQERRAGFEAYEDALQRGRMQGARQDQPTIAATPGRPYGDVASTAARALREAGARGEPARQAAARTARDLRDTPGITDEQVAQYAARMLLEASTPELTPGEPTDAQGPEGTQAPTGTPPPAAEAGDSGSPAPDAGMRARTPQTPQPGQPAPGQPTRADLTWETRQYLYDLRYTDDDIAAMQPDEPAFLVEHRIGREEWTPKEPTDAVQEAVRPPVPAEAAPQQRPAPLEAPGQGRAVPEGQRLRQPADQQPDDVGPAAVGDRAGRGTENPPDGNRQAVRDRTPAAGALNETPPPQRGPEPTADRPGPAAGTADAARQGPADARRPQPRTPTPARKPKRGEWSRADIDRRIVTAAERLGIDAVESARDTDELSTEREVSLATRAPQLPTEIREALEGKPHLKRYFQTNMRNGTLEDSMADLGVDRLIQHAEELAGNDSAKARDHLRKMAGYDPEAAFLTWLRDVQPGNARLREKWQVVDNPAQALDEGDTLRINGREFEVVTDGDYKMLTERGEDGDGLTVHLEALDALPVDADSIGRPADPDQETEPPSREPDKAGQSRTKPDNPDPIVTPTDDRARVAGEIKAAFGEEGEAFLPIMDAFVAGLPEGRRNRYWEGLHVTKGGEHEGPVLWMTAWHGSPHKFEKFSTEKIGTGEGAQVYGYGLYFSSKREIGEHYRNALSRRLVQYENRTLNTDQEIAALAAERLKAADVKNPEHGERAHKALIDTAWSFADVYRQFQRGHWNIDEVVERSMGAFSGELDRSKVRKVLSDLADGMDDVPRVDRPTFVPQVSGGTRAYRGLTDRQKADHFEISTRLYWLNPETMTPEQAMARVRSDLERTASVQAERLERFGDARRLTSDELATLTAKVHQGLVQAAPHLDREQRQALSEWAADVFPTSRLSFREVMDNLAAHAKDEWSGGAPPEFYGNELLNEAWDMAYKSRLDVQRLDTKTISDNAQRWLRFIDEHKVTAQRVDPAGRLYEVDLVPTDEELLDWNKPLGEHEGKIAATLRDKLAVRKDTEPSDSKWIVTLDGHTVGGFNTRKAALEWTSTATGEQLYQHIALTKGQSHTSKFLHGLGIRGIRYKGDTSGAINYVIFDDNDIVVRKFHQDQAAPKPSFYSAAERAVEAFKDQKGRKTGAEWDQYLRNVPGIKPDEMDWIDLPAATEKMTAKEAAAYIRAHNAEIIEVRHGEDTYTLARDEMLKPVPGLEWKKAPDSRFGQPRIVATTTLPDGRLVDFTIETNDDGTARVTGLNQYSDWTYRSADEAKHAIERGLYPARRGIPTRHERLVEPGGTNYREMLLLMPDRNRSAILERMARAAGVDSIQEAERRFGAEASRLQTPDYTHPHWQERNVLAHIRWNDRTGPDGKRTLFIEEIQSDWHQTARDLRKDEVKRRARLANIKKPGKDEPPNPEYDAIEAAVPADFGYAAGTAKPTATIPEGWMVRRVEVGEHDLFGMTVGDWALFDDGPDGGEPVGSVPGTQTQEDATIALVRDALDAQVDIEGLSLTNANPGPPALPAHWVVRKIRTQLEADELDAEIGHWGVFDDGANGIIPLGPQPDGATATQAAIESAIDAGIDLDEMGGRSGRALPNAPFKKSWQALAMKRMMMYAVEHGYDRIAWTYGDMQNRRYDLSTRVDEITVRRDGPGHYRYTARKNGRTLVEHHTLTPEDLTNHLGDELANRATTALVDDEYTTLKGQDLQVGGSGMRGAYDDILPKETNKLLKKWGGKTGLVDLHFGLTEDDAPDLVPFDDDDWDQWAGAESWSESDRPLIGSATITVDGRQTPVVVIADKNGVQFHPNDGEWYQVHWPAGNGTSGENSALAIRIAWTKPDSWIWTRMQSSVPNDFPTIKPGPASTTDTVHGFDITPKMREDIATLGLPMWQRDATGEPHASYEITAAGRRIIRALTDPNAASLPHEVAHDWLEMLPILDPPMAQKAYAALGVKPGEKPTTGQHEQFARGFEAYQREGKAPTKALESTFAKFKQWLRNLYRAIRGTPLEGKLTPELRAFFTELLGRSEQAAAIRAATPNVASATPNVAEPAAGGTLDKTTGEQPQTGAEQPPPGPDPWMTSARQTMTDDDRASMGLDELDSPERRGWQQAIDTARQRGLNTAEKAMRLAAEV